MWYVSPQQQMLALLIQLSSVSTALSSAAALHMEAASVCLCWHFLTAPWSCPNKMLILYTLEGCMAALLTFRDGDAEWHQIPGGCQIQHSQLRWCVHKQLCRG